LRLVFQSLSISAYPDAVSTAPDVASWGSCADDWFTAGRRFGRAHLM